MVIGVTRCKTVGFKRFAHTESKMNTKRNGYGGVNGERNRKNTLTKKYERRYKQYCADSYKQKTVFNVRIL